MMPYRLMRGRYAMFAGEYLVCGMSNGVYLWRDGEWLGPFATAGRVEAAACA